MAVKKTTPARKTAAPAKKTAAPAKPAAKSAPAAETVTAMSVLKQLSDAFDALQNFKELGGFEGIAFAAVAGSAANAPVELDEEETRSLSITALRALAVKLGLDEQKVKSGILEELEEKGLFAESDEEDDEDEDVEDDDSDEDEADEEEDDEEDEDDDSEDDEDEEYTREELEELSLKELRAVAKEEGHTVAETRGLDQEGLIVLILGEDDEDGDEDEEDDEEMEVDEDQLRAMPLDELKKLAKSFGIKVPPRISQPKLVELILDEAAEEE